MLQQHQYLCCIACSGFQLEQAPGETPEDVRKRHIHLVTWQWQTQIMSVFESIYIDSVHNDGNRGHESWHMTLHYACCNVVFVSISNHSTQELPAESDMLPSKQDLINAVVFHSQVRGLGWERITYIMKMGNSWGSSIFAPIALALDVMQPALFERKWEHKLPAHKAAFVFFFAVWIMSTA